jgi:hypothetical protein
MRPEAKDQFFLAARVMGLSNEARDLAWSRIRDLGLTPDDPTVIYLAVGGLLEAAAKEIPDAVKGLPAAVEAAARRAVGPVSEAAAKAASTNILKLADSISERVGVAIEQEAQSAFAALKDATEFRLNINLIGVITICFGLIGLVGFGQGKSRVEAIAQEWQALALRADAEAWFALAETNPNLAATLRGSCGPSSPAAYVVNGSRACNVPLWIDAPAAPAASGSAFWIYTSILSWLNAWSPVVVLGSGIVVGLLLRRAARSLASIAPLRWLLDL